MRTPPARKRSVRSRVCLLIALGRQHREQGRLGAQVAHQPRGKLHIVFARLAVGHTHQHALQLRRRARCQQQMMLAGLQQLLGQLDVALLIGSQHHQVIRLALDLAQRRLCRRLGRRADIQRRQAAADLLFGRLQMLLKQRYLRLAGHRWP